MGRMKETLGAEYQVWLMGDVDGPFLLFVSHCPATAIAYGNGWAKRIKLGSGLNIHIRRARY